MPLRRRSFTRGTPRGLRCPVACPQMIEAPHAASRHCEIEEHEAVDDSQLARVQERKEAPRRVRYEVCEGHVACQDERDRTCEQAEHDQHPTDELNYAVDARERHGGHSRRGRNWQAKIFRHPMLQEQQANDDAQDTQHTWGPRCEKAVDRRHHNFSYERPEACQTPRPTPRSSLRTTFL